MGELSHQDESEGGNAEAHPLNVPVAKMTAITKNGVATPRSSDSRQNAATNGVGHQVAHIVDDGRDERLRLQQIKLLSVARGVFQMARICFGPLAVSIAAEYGYDNTQKGKVLAVFASGYALTQVVGGVAADRFGGKPLILVGLFTSAGSLFLLPLAADAGFDYLWWLLFFMGFTQGPTYPAQISTTAKWVKTSDVATTDRLKSYASSYASAGSTTGALLALGLTPNLVERAGWRRTAWFFATLTALFGFLVLCLGRSSPETSTPPERSSAAKPLRLGIELQRRLRVILSLPVLATFVAHSCSNFVRYFLMAWMPTYYVQVLNVSESASSFHLVIPEVCGLAVSVAVGRIGLGSKFPALITRRLFSSIAFLGPFVGLLLCTTVSTPAYVTLFLCFVRGLSILEGHGWGSSYVEVSKHYCGLVTGFGNTVATAASFVAPMFASRLMPETTSAGPQSWNSLFVSFACANLVGLIVYCFFCSVKAVDLDEDVNSKSKSHAD